MLASQGVEIYYKYMSDSPLVQICNLSEQLSYGLDIVHVEPCCRLKQDILVVLPSQGTDKIVT